MAGTRSSARQASQNSSSPSAADKQSNGTKRKAADDNSQTSPTQSKRGKSSKPAAEEPPQKTLEETMPSSAKDDLDAEEANGPAAQPQNPPQDDHMQEVADEGKNTADLDSQFDRPDGCWFWLDKATYDRPDIAAVAAKAGAEAGEEKIDDEKTLNEPGQSFKGENKHGETKEDPEKALKDSRGGKGVNALDKVAADESDAGKTSKKENTDDQKEEANGSQQAQGEAIEEDKNREKQLPSNVLEKGIIYFFTRGRVGVNDPDSVQDIARSYFVLRPLPDGAKITDGNLQDTETNRVCALPKKVWPKSGKDRFMSFVDEAKVTMAHLKDSFFSGSEYSTKTTGTSQQPGVTPLGEGVYAITTTGGGQGTTHLTYMLTIPTEVGEVQKDMGLADKGSFVLSLKNPESSGPANAQLPQGPAWPSEFQDEFHGRGWMPVHPKHLDYANAQMLLIGEDFEGSNNLEPAAKDESKDKISPQEELEKLEHEDDLRVEHLKGDDTIFADLGISSKEYPKVMTTW